MSLPFLESKLKSMQINNLSSFPKQPHYAILVFTEQHIHHEGDERSRTHPGHGYPAYTETIRSIDYISFGDDEQALKDWITKEKTSIYTKKNFQVIRSSPVEFTIQTEIKLK